VFYKKRKAFVSTVPSNKFGIRVGCDFIMQLVTCDF
jgi:hypothetical protein